MPRTHSTAATAGGGAGGFDRVTEDGTEYLVHDVVAQKEGVYHYPDPGGGTRKEFVSSDELTTAIENVDEVPFVIPHPQTDEGNPTLTTDPRANIREVGVWRDLRETADGTGIGGKVYIRANEVGAHDGLVEEYVAMVEQRGVGPVSTGYDIKQAVPDPGRFNGEQYGFRQQGLQLDHLAGLPHEQGDCSVEDGCGLGRANQAEGATIRTHNHFPGTDDALTSSPTEGTAEVPAGTDPLRQLGRQVAESLGWTRFFDGGTTPAESGTEQSDTMKDADKIDKLVEQHGFTRANLEPLDGTECLGRIHEAVTEDAQRDNETPSDNGGSDGQSDADVDLDARIEAKLDEKVPTAEDIAAEIGDLGVDEDNLVEKATEQVEQARAHERNVELIATSDDLPHIDRDRAERMNKDVVAELAEDLDDSTNRDTESRANFAGRPTGTSFDVDDYSGDGDFDIPAAGRTPGMGGDSE